MTTLTDMVLNKHDLDNAIFDAARTAGEVLGNGAKVSDLPLLDMAGRFYDHERFVRGCSHTAAAAETVDMLDRVRESMNAASRRALERAVRDKRITYAEYRDRAAAAEQEAQTIVDDVQALLTVGGMGTDPAYRVNG